MERKRLEKVPFIPTPDAEALFKIDPGIGIPEDFWDLPDYTRKDIIEDIKIKKEAGMSTAQLYLDYLDLIEVSQKLESMGHEDSDRNEPIPKDEDAKNFAEAVAERIEKKEEKPN